MDVTAGPLHSAAADTPDLPDEDFDHRPIPEPGEAGRIEAIDELASESDTRSSAQMSEEI